MNLIKEIPAQIWAAVIAALLAFGGVLLSNAINLRSLSKRIEHEAREAQLKRKSDIRKEVYLEAVQELINANVYLLSLIQQVPEDGISLGEGMRGFSVANAKMQMLMNQEDALAVADLSASYNKIFIRLLPALLPIKNLQDQIRQNAKWIERMDTEVARILSEQTVHNEKGNTDADGFQRLQRSFESHQALAKKFKEEQSAMWAQLAPIQRQASLEVLRQLREIQPQLVKVGMAMRRDFEVYGSEDAFLQNVIRQMDESIAVLSESLADIDKHMQA